MRRIYSMALAAAVAVALAQPVAAQQPWMEKSVVEAAERTLASMPADFYQAEPEAVVKLIENAQPFVLDVREPKEVEQGRIAGAVAIPIRDIPRSLARLPENRAAPIITYCKVGYRGGLAMATLRMLGYTNVRTIKGGLDAWQKAGLPVDTKKPS